MPRILVKVNFLWGREQGGRATDYIERKKKRKRERDIVKRDRNAEECLRDEKCTHALFARADTPPFHPFLRCTGAENDREKGDAGRTKGGKREKIAGRTKRLR